MKRIVVGRGSDCDIIIPDEEEGVSRHHLVITFRLTGKMTLNDTSINGTFINDTRMLKGATLPVTRNDEIRLGENVTLDWALVKDPYRNTRRLLAALAGGLLLTFAAQIGWNTYRAHLTDRANQVAPDDGSDISPTFWTKDSTNKVAPTEERVSIKRKQ